MKKSLFVGVLALIAIAAYARSAGKTIKVETDPPGMRVYFCVASSEAKSVQEREYVGVSPCEVVVAVDGAGRFRNKISKFVHPVALFMADPPSGSTNLFSQEQAFEVPAIFHRAAAAPDAVFFDMHKKPLL